MTEKIQPEHSIRLGNVKASLWPNEGKNGTYYGVSLRRVYKDQDGNLADTPNFHRDDLPLVASVAQLAIAYILGNTD
jgi:hypothetical protein